jgi:hypothetical protein
VRADADFRVPVAVIQGNVPLHPGIREEPSFWNPDFDGTLVSKVE